MKSLLYFVWALIATALSIGAWSVSTPLGAAPDEPNHVTQAAAVVRGEFDGPKVASVFGRIGTMEVPQWVVNLKPECFLYRPDVPASCEPSVGTSTRTVVGISQFSNYPPLYYLIVGVPTLLATGSGALYGVRFSGALVDAALIALGLFLLARYHPRRLPLLGAMIALSPMVLFVTAVVNSEGVITRSCGSAIV